MKKLHLVLTSPQFNPGRQSKAFDKANEDEFYELVEVFHSLDLKGFATFNTSEAESQVWTAISRFVMA